MEEIKCEQVGMLSGGKWEKCHETNRRVYSDKGLSPTITTMGGGQRESKIIEPRIAAMRGRNPDNPSDRTAGNPTEQRLEIGNEETSNTLTTVQKDNLVVESQIINPLAGKTEYSWFFEQNVYAPEGIIRALKAGEGSGNIPKVVEPIWDNDLGCFIDKNSGEWLIDNSERPPIEPAPQYRIRKLTPDECFRLMSVKQEDFERVAKNQSTSSLYHLAGDSICCTCLMAIFGQLLGGDYQTKINELVEELKQ